MVYCDGRLFLCVISMGGAMIDISVKRSIAIKIWRDLELFYLEIKRIAEEIERRGGDESVVALYMESLQDYKNVIDDIDKKLWGNK